jgi:hypothetical protein
VKQPILNVIDPAGSLTGTHYCAPSAGSWVASASAPSIIGAGEVVAAAGAYGNMTISRRDAVGSGGGIAPGVGISETYTLYVNGVATTCTVTISGAAQHTASFSGFPATVGPGDVITLVQVVSGGTPTVCVHSIALVFHGTTRQRSTHGFNISLGVGAGITYIAPFNGRLNGTSTSGFSANIVGTQGDVSAHYVKLTTAPGVGKSWTLEFYADGVRVDAATVVIADTALEGSATFTVPCVPVEMTAGVPTAPSTVLQAKLIPSGSPAATRMAYGVRFDADDLVLVNQDTMAVIANINDNLSNFILSQTNLTGAARTDYMVPFVDPGSTGPKGRNGIMPDVAGTDFNVVLTDLGIHVETGPGSGAERLFSPAHATDLVTYADSFTARPSISGSQVYTGTPTVSGANQFAGYDAGAAFTIRQVATGTLVATSGRVMFAMRMLADQYAVSGVAFDGTLTSIAPTSGPVAGNTSITITGSGFQGTVDSGSGHITGVSGITFRGIAATNILVVNDTTITCKTGVSPNSGIGDVVVTFTTDVGIATSTASLTDAFTYIQTNRWWTVDNPTAADMAATGLTGQPPNGPISVFQETPPTANFLADTPDPYGWWSSPDGLNGSPVVSDGSGVPKGVRTIVEVAAFATGTAVHLQGQPGCAAVLRNKLLYAGRGYTVGTDGPTLRIFDGTSDRFLTRVPALTGTPARAILSMITANATLYFASLDSATAGRVFVFDLDTLTVTRLGASFTGEVPYALCWHLGRLWCGTNKGNGTAGNVYYIRPGIDNAWTLDHAMSANSLGGVCALASYQGKLYVGSDNVSTANGKVLVRAETGTYTVSETGTGTSAMNGYHTLAVFANKLYAGYYSSTSTVAKLRRFDGSAWSTVYTGASLTARPTLALFTHDDAIYALFGDNTSQAALISSPTGDSGDYDDLTAFLVASDVKATPAFASLRF